jgi:hypothetical protein
MQTRPLLQRQRLGAADGVDGRRLEHPHDFVFVAFGIVKLRHFPALPRRKVGHKVTAVGGLGP